MTRRALASSRRSRVRTCLSTSRRSRPKASAAWPRATRWSSRSRRVPRACRRRTSARSDRPPDRRSSGLGDSPSPLFSRRLYWPHARSSLRLLVAPLARRARSPGAARLPGILAGDGLPRLRHARPGAGTPRYAALQHVEEDRTADGVRRADPRPLGFDQLLPQRLRDRGQGGDALLWRLRRRAPREAHTARPAAAPGSGRTGAAWRGSTGAGAEGRVGSTSISPTTT